VNIIYFYLYINDNKYLLIKSVKKESLNTYDDIYDTIKEILETKEHLTNYLKHSYKIYK
jgi:hypothetical protein